jgi:hypothetical protein
MTAAVLDGQQRALELVLDSIESRVIALERYAATLEAADAAERDLDRALRVSSQNDSYLDLVAPTVTDNHAIAEIADLTEQAAIPKKVYLESLHLASLAAEVLTLPADTRELATRPSQRGCIFGHRRPQGERPHLPRTGSGAAGAAVPWPCHLGCCQP